MASRGGRRAPEGDGETRVKGQGLEGGPHFLLQTWMHDARDKRQPSVQLSLLM